MKRALLLITLILLTSPFILAEETIIHNEWHPYQDYFTIDEDYYEVINDHKILSDGVRIQTLLKRNQATYIISTVAEEPDNSSLYKLAKEECKSEGYLRFCVVDISLEPSDEARADEAGKYHYGTKIIIYEEKPEEADITITKSIGQTSLHYDEETKVSVTLTNEGTIKATNIFYNETIAEGLVITNHKEYTYRLSTKLKATIPVLYVGESKTFQYWIKAEEYLNKSTIISTVDYEAPDKKSITKTDTISIIWPYTWTTSINKDEVGINKLILHTVTIQNKENKPMEAILTVRPEDSLIISEADSYTKIGKKYLYEITIPEETTETITLEAYNKYTGTYNISTNIQLQVNEKNFELSKTDSFNVKTDTINPSILLSKNKMRSGESITIGFYLKNEDENIAFYNINGWAGSDFFNQTFTIETLPKNKEENVIFKPYHPPTTETEIVEHDIELAGTFITQNGEEKNFYTKKTITVIPKNLSILLTQSINKKELKRGEELTIIIDVENIADSGSNFVQARDYYDEKLELIFGNSYGETFLYPGEERELYLYKIRIPYDYTKENFTIISKLTAKGQPLMNINNLVKVTDPLEQGELPPEIIDEPIDEIIDEPVDNTTKEPIDEPIEETNITTQEEPINQPEQNEEPYGKEGFFKKMINGIADFFTNFFS